MQIIKFYTAIRSHKIEVQRNEWICTNIFSEEKVTKCIIPLIQIKYACLKITAKYFTMTNEHVNIYSESSRMCAHQNESGDKNLRA